MFRYAVVNLRKQLCVTQDGKGDGVLACGCGVGVAGFRRDGDRLGRVVGLGAEGWGGGSVDAVLSSTVSAVAFVLVPSSALPVSMFVASACAYCSAVARGCMASAIAAMDIVAPTMDVHAFAQSR